MKERRLVSLRELRTLDTEPEERLDRITRLAAAVFDVPIALVSLVDKDRLWSKSCHGVSAKETSREAFFCAHVVYNREMMLVTDALVDLRFADNPLVVNEPRVRVLCRVSEASRFGSLASGEEHQQSGNRDVGADRGNVVPAGERVRIVGDPARHSGEAEEMLRKEC
jgi:hypothetical protein